MNPTGSPEQPGPYLPPTDTGAAEPARRHIALRVIGWFLIGFGVLGALISLISADGAGGKFGGLLIGLAFAAVGAVLVWKSVNWKAGVPAAIVALMAGGALSPAPPKAEPVVSPASSSAVSTTTTTTTTTASSSAAPSSSAAASTTTSTAATTTTTAPSTAATATTTTTMPLPPGVAETDTRTPVPTPRQVIPTTTTQAPPAGGGGNGSGSGGGVYYPNCKAARAAGAAPILRGQPGYRPGLDGDGDGVACDKG